MAGIIYLIQDTGSEFYRVGCAQDTFDLVQKCGGGEKLLCFSMYDYNAEAILQYLLVEFKTHYKWHDNDIFEGTLWSMIDVIWYILKGLK